MTIKSVDIYWIPLPYQKSTIIYIYVDFETPYPISSVAFKENSFQDEDIVAYFLRHGLPMPRSICEAASVGEEVSRWEVGDEDWVFINCYGFTLQGTNISPKNGTLKMIFLFKRWDMLIPWRVSLMEKGKS